MRYPWPWIEEVAGHDAFPDRNRLHLYGADGSLLTYWVEEPIGRHKQDGGDDTRVAIPSRSEVAAARGRMWEDTLAESN